MKNLKQFWKDLEPYGNKDNGYYINEVYISFCLPHEYWPDVKEDDDDQEDLLLGLIETRSQYRNQGRGKTCLKFIIELLDKYELSCCLEVVQTEKDMNISRLLKFYELFGFEDDCIVGMVRYPNESSRNTTLGNISPLSDGT